MKWDIAIKCAGGEESVPQPREQASSRLVMERKQRKLDGTGWEGGGDVRTRKTG